MTELSILMPAFNEEATIERAIERVLAADLGTDSYELVIVDDGSTDRTRALLGGREWPGEVRITYAAENRGKGQAIRTALAEARGTYSVILDADLEYDPGAAFQNATWSGTHRVRSSANSDSSQG